MLKQYYDGDESRTIQASQVFKMCQDFELLLALHNDPIPTMLEHERIDDDSEYFTVMLNNRVYCVERIFDSYRALDVTAERPVLHDGTLIGVDTENNEPTEAEEIAREILAACRRYNINTDYPI